MRCAARWQVWRGRSWKPVLTVKRRPSTSRSATSAEIRMNGSIDAYAPDLLHAGQVIRSARLRSGLSLTAVEKKIGLDPSTISRFERGQEGRRLGRDSLEALAEAVRVEPRERLEVFRHLGLPPSIERELAAPELAGAFEGAQLPEETSAVLRHRHLATVAQKYLSVPMPRVGPIDPVVLLKAHRVQVHEVPGQRPWVRIAGDVWFDGGGPRARQRFLLAHAAAHHALAKEGEPDALKCSLPRVDDLDASANALAWLILLPGDRLRLHVHAMGGETVAWEEDGGLQRVVEVAQHFDVPVLAAAKRMSEEGLIPEMWGLGEP